MKFFTKEVKIAIADIIGIVVLFYGLQFLKGLSVMGNDDSYYVRFSDVSGISASTPVYANGYKVGVVENVDFDYTAHNKIVATVGLNKQMRVPRGSRAEISSDLLGNIKINLILGDDPINIIAKGDTIPGESEQGMMSKIGALMPAVEAMMPKLDSILTSLNKLLSDPALSQTLHNMEGMTGELNATSKELHHLSASLNREVPNMMQKANNVLDNTEQVTGNLAAVDVVGMSASINQTLANVNEMTRKLNSNEGTLGLLMRDATLYRNLNAVAVDADSLLVDLRYHPKRYVHFSIFGGKK